MAIKKTLGGDRLGAGKKMQVELHNYERSTHDLSYLFQTTMSAGTLVPFMSELGLPGDTFDIKLLCEILTHPTIGPLFSSFKVQLDVFKADIRLYQAKLHNNKLNVGLHISDIKLPLMRLYAFYSQNASDDIDNSQINPSCLLSYLDIRGVGYMTDPNVTSGFWRDFTALKILSYWDIYKNYYANKQENVGYVIHGVRPTLNTTITSIDILNPPGYTPVTLPQQPTAPSAVPIGVGSLIRLNYTGAVPNPETVMVLHNGEFVNLTSLFGSPTTTAGYVQLVYNGISTPSTLEQWRYIKASDDIPKPPRVEEFMLTNLDSMREAIMETINEPAPFLINEHPYEPFNYLCNPVYPTSDYELNYSLNQEGLAVKTYQSDLFNNWLRTESIIGPDSISAVTAVDTSSGSFTMDALILARKVYDMLNRISISGASYDDYIDAVYAHERYSKPEIPVYCGGLSKELIFQEVISNSGNENQPLGTLAGRGTMSNKHKGGEIYIKVDEPCYIFGIISITPRLTYSQGTKWDNHLKTLNDLHKPGLDGIGFQNLLTNQMAWWTDTPILPGTPNGIWSSKSAGFQPAWINYMTNVNKARGNFAIKNNEMFMTLNRRYEHDAVNFDIKDLTTYIDPAKFNHIFAQTSLDAQNFWTQIGVNITARRKMSAKQIPNL